MLFITLVIALALFKPKFHTRYTYMKLCRVRRVDDVSSSNKKEYSLMEFLSKHTHSSPFEIYIWLEGYGYVMFYFKKLPFRPP